MLNTSFLACTKVELWDLTVCIAINSEKFQSRTVTLTLVPTMPNIELVRVIFIFYNVMCLYFTLLGRFLFELSCKNTETHTHTHTQTLMSTL